MPAPTPDISVGFVRYNLGDYVAAHLRRVVTSPGFAGPLPSERTISQQLGVSRPTVRAALATLREEGLTLARARRGRKPARPYPSA